MSQHEALTERLDKTRIYLVGNNELTEMMTSMYETVRRCLSIEVYDSAEIILELMEKEIDAADENMPDMYIEQIEHRLRVYKRGEPFEDDENWTEPV